MTGFVDLQVNGYYGIDFNGDDLSTEELATACRRMRDDGVELFLPTIITDDLRTMCMRIRRLAQAVESDLEVAEMVAGVHVEGPFLNRKPGFIGAHPPYQARQATVDHAMKLLEAGRGLVRLVTLAPEVEGAGEVIRRLTQENVVVAAGHCDPTLDDLWSAIESGLSMVTHLGNACPSLLNRHDNVIQRVLSLAKYVSISFIADGHHIPFFALANYLACVPDENIIIVSDAITAAGLGPGKYTLAGQVVEVDDDLSAWAEGREHFAGCATTLPRMKELLVKHLDFVPDRVHGWMSDNPRRLLDRKS